MLSKSHVSKQFEVLLADYDFRNIISVPTRITPSSSTLLDLIITNYWSEVKKSGAQRTGISDHLPVFMVIPTYKLKQRQHILPQSVTEKALVAFENEISMIDWGFVYRCDDPDMAYNRFF